MKRGAILLTFLFLFSTSFASAETATVLLSSDEPHAVMYLNGITYDIDMVVTEDLTAKLYFTDRKSGEVEAIQIRSENDIEELLELNVEIVDYEINYQTRNVVVKLRISDGYNAEIQEYSCSYINNLISLWDGGGDTKDDYGGQNGKWVGNDEVYYAYGKVGSSFYFNGEENYMIVPSSSKFNVDAITIEAWIYPEKMIGSQGIVSRGIIENGYETGGFSLHFGRDNILACSISLDNFGFLTTTNKKVINANEWTHVACTYDPIEGAAHVYINGIQSTHHSDYKIKSSNEDIKIGMVDFGNGNINFFNGKIDEVSIFNRALSESEINSIYKAGSDGKCTSSPTVSKPDLVVENLKTYGGGEDDAAAVWVEYDLRNIGKSPVEKEFMMLISVDGMPNKTYGTGEILAMIKPLLQIQEVICRCLNLESQHTKLIKSILFTITILTEVTT